MNRTMTQPGSPGMAAAPAAGAAKGGFFNRPGMGMLGGLAAGFLGAGLLGMLFGGGLFSGLGGMAVDHRPDPADRPGHHRGSAGDEVVAAPQCDGVGLCRVPAAGPATGSGPQASFRNGTGLRPRIRQRAAGDRPADYEAFERLLGDVQTAWSNEDIAKLHTLATPEMVSYFTKDLEENKARNDINKVSDVKLLQGDLAEAWREGETDYASVAMRFSLVDKTLERGTDRLVAGSETADRGHRSVDLRAADAARIGNSRRSSRPDRLRNSYRRKGAAVHSAAPFSFCEIVPMSFRRRGAGITLPAMG